MTWLFLNILSWLTTTWIYQTYKIDTWYIQNQIVVEWYFDWVDSYNKIIYRLGRNLGQRCNDPKCKSTIMSDCWGLMIGYMINLWLLSDRFRNDKGIRWTYDKWWLNSYRLYKMWNAKSYKDRKRWDFMYMEFEGWVRHFAVYCWDNKMYDLYMDKKAKCRPLPKTTILRYSTNWLEKYLTDRNIILPQTKSFISKIKGINEEKIYNFNYSRNVNLINSLLSKIKRYIPLF